MANEYPHIKGPKRSWLIRAYYTVYDVFDNFYHGAMGSDQPPKEISVPQRPRVGPDSKMEKD